MSSDLSLLLPYSPLLSSLSSPAYAPFPSFSEEKTSDSSTKTGILLTPDSVKERRKIFAYSKNFTPSVVYINVKADDVIQHAFLRMQLFYLEALARQGLGVRSDSTKCELSLQIVGARKQGGAGSNGNHAAHSNAVSGLADNMRDLIYDQIKSEKQLTPQKRQILKSISPACTDSQLDLLTTSKDIDAIFAIIWPKSYAHESLLEHSRFHNIANTTNSFPAALNLHCDCPLERTIRKDVTELFKKVMLNEKTPEDATQEYANMILFHFDTIIPLLEKEISDIKKYKTHLNTLLSLSNLAKLNEAKTNKLFEQLLELRNPQAFSSNKEYDSAYPENIALIQNILDLLTRGCPKKAIAKVISKKNLKKANEEISKNSELLKEILNYNEWEKKGTALPDYAKLIGKFISKNKHEMLSPPSKQKLKMSLLSPSPQKSSLKAVKLFN